MIKTYLNLNSENILMHSCRYSTEQMYKVISDVEKYPEFVPYCKKITVPKKRKSGHMKVDMTVGFPPITEKYTSLVTLSEPYLVKVCTKPTIDFDIFS